MHRGLFLVAGTSAIAVIAIVGFHQPIDNQLHSWKVLPEPEKLTELYFTHPNSLPTTYTPGGTQAVSFTVHNLEYSQFNYRYRIIEINQAGNDQQTLSDGSFSLSQNQYAHPTVSITTADLGPRVKVEVQLVNVNESIDYWVSKEGA